MKMSKRDFVVALAKTVVLLAVAVVLVVTSAAAQAATRPVVISWTAPLQSGVTGYNLYRCTVAVGGTACTPALTTPLNAALVTSVNYTDNASVAAAYGYSVLAVYPPCTPTTPVNTACGNSAPATLTYVPVPPQGGSGSNVVIVVP